MSVHLTPPFRAVGVDAFSKVYMTIGRVNSARINESAKIPAYLIELIFSDRLMSEHLGLAKKEFYTSSAQLLSNHSVEDLTSSLMLCVINFPRKQIGKVMSDCLVTGVQKCLDSPDAKRETTIFVKPACDVNPGSRVVLLPSSMDDTIIETNPRNLTWPEFLDLDLRIGEVDGFEILERDFRSSLLKVKCLVNFGMDGRVDCIAAFRKSFDIRSLLSRQVLVLTNLNKEETAMLFDINFDVAGVVLTVDGKAILEPAKKVEPSFKLA
jgi:tRNA-binding protein